MYMTKPGPRYLRDVPIHDTGERVCFFCGAPDGGDGNGELEEGDDGSEVNAGGGGGDVCNGNSNGNGGKGRQ
jgi:hypothetical protein